MIPDGWREVCFGDVAVLRNGLNYTSEDDQCSIRMIGVGAFQDNMIMDGIEGLPCISTASEIKDRDLINDDDLLFVRSNGNKQLIGRCMLIRPNGERVSHSGFTIRAIVQKKHLLPLYMAQLARTDIIKRAILLEGGGTNISNLSQKILASLKLRLPPVAEQLDILHVLSTWDRAIEKTEALIKAKERRKAGLMQRLLTGKLRFGGFGPGASEDCPDGWRVCRIEDVCKRVSRKNSIGELRVLTASGEHGLVDQREYFNRSVAGESLANYYLLKRGEFAYNRSSMKGYPYGAIKRLDQYDAGILSTLYICFAVREDKANLDFMRHFFDSTILNKGLRGIVQVGARAHGLLNVSVGDFMRLTICIPKMKEQERIAKALNVAVAEIDEHCNQLAALKEQKKGLMQQLLTGKVRVKVS